MITFFIVMYVLYELICSNEMQRYGKYLMCKLSCIIEIIKTHEMSYPYTMQLTLDAPWYFILLCLLLGAGYAALLYFVPFRRKAAAVSEDTTSLGRTARIVLSVLRATTVSLIAFLLLAPMVRREVSEREKPIILVAEDNSKSLVYTGDSAYYRGGYAEAMQRLCHELAEKYEVQRFTYGSTLQQAEEGGAPDYAARCTDMSTAVDELMQRYAHRNVGALLLTGDGLYNQGYNPTTRLQQVSFPIYTVALGDTSARRDAAISHVKCNSMAYLGNRFPIEITVRASRLQGQSKLLTVQHNGRTLFSKAIAYADNDFTATETVFLEADRAGVQQYVVQIAVADGESSVRNNRYEVPIEVIDGRQKIAVVGAVPHPDLSALKRSLERQQNYEVTVALASDFKDNPKDYDMMVLHQLPAKGGLGGDIAQRAVASRVPLLFVLGEQSDLPRFNVLKTGLEVHAKLNRTNEVTALKGETFTAFDLADETTRRIEALPPLTAPFGNYKLSGTGQILFSAQIGTVNSGQPLVAVCQQQEVRYSFVAGEGLWRWRLADYRQNGNSQVFDEMLNKLTTYTALRLNKERFRVTTKKVWDQSDEVILEAELYNENYEPVNHPEVRLELQRTALQEEGASSATATYQFNKEGTGYIVNVGKLEPGEYRYRAAVDYNGRREQVQGMLLVQEVNLEDVNLVADHTLMNSLAVLTGGVMLAPSQLDTLPLLLEEREDITPVIYTHRRYSELIQLPWLFALLVLLVAVEWAWRKYSCEL